MVHVINAVIQGHGLDLDGHGRIVLGLRNVLAQGHHDSEAVPDQDLNQRIVNIVKASQSLQNLVAPGVRDLAAKVEKIEVMLTKEVIRHHTQRVTNMEVPKESLKVTGVRNLHDSDHEAQEASHQYHIHLERIKIAIEAVWNMTEENKNLILIMQASVIRSLEASGITVTGSHHQNIVVATKKKREVERLQNIIMALIQKNMKWMRKRREVWLKKVTMMNVLEEKPNQNLTGLISRSDHPHHHQIVVGLMKIWSLLMPICPG